MTACVDCIPEDRDTMPCCDICKGLFFFFYLPTLPLWWTLEFLWGFVKRKRQRHRRKKRYRAAKQSRVEKEKDCYLSVDQYTRGKVEKQILGISQKNKARKAQQKKQGSHSHTLNKVYRPCKMNKSVYMQVLMLRIRWRMSILLNQVTLLMKNR